MCGSERIHADKYHISSYSFCPWIASAPLCTVTFGLKYCDLWISKFKTKPYEGIRYMIFSNILKLKSFKNWNEEQLLLKVLSKELFLALHPRSSLTRPVDNTPFNELPCSSVLPTKNSWFWGLQYYMHPLILRPRALQDAPAPADPNS